MRNILLVAAAAFIIIGLVSVFLKYVGDIRPAFVPSNRNLAKLLSRESIAQTAHKTGKITPLPLKLPSGYHIGTFASDIRDPRIMAFTPGGTLLVTLQDPGKVVALPDVNKDGIADEVVEVINNLDNPHGIVFVPKLEDSAFLVAETTSVKRYHWDENTKSSVLEKEIVRLPSGGRHVTRSLAFDREGRLYISIGSTCDVCKEGDSRNGSVMISDAQGASPQIYSTGLRNAVYLTLDESTDQIWATEMGRDFLGDELPPDEIDILQKGGNYGWPYCYGDKVYDTSFNGVNPDYCSRTIAPIYQIPAHSAPLGLLFIRSPQFPAGWQGDLLVAYHGSWNRSSPTGYKVIRMHVQNGRVVDVSDFLTGFLQGSQSLGRPTGLIFDRDGSLYVADDKSNAIYKIVKNE